MSAFHLSFRPRLLDCLKTYKSADLFADFSSGITVALIALPLAMAFAIASGLKPEAGLFTAIVAGFIISAFGGSRVQIGGPAGAFIVIVYGIIAKYGIDGLLLSTMMAGVMLFAMGVLGLGALIRFVPVAIIIGFTNGIAVLIALSQVKDVLGLQIEKMPAGFFAQLNTLGQHIGSVSWPTLALSLACLVVVFGWPRLAQKLGKPALQRLPGSVILLVLATAAVYFLHLPVETVGSKFGGIPSTLPQLKLPVVSWEVLQNLLAPAITIALLCAIESLLCARVADGLIDERHDPNQELMAQGMANFAAPLFGGFCATGTIARTVANVKMGARSPVSGIIHALTLLLIMLVAAPLAGYVPLAALGAILLFVAFNMGEWHEFVRMRDFSSQYRLILLSTFLLTVIVDLTVAVEVGLLLSCLFFITRVAGLTRLEPIAETEIPGRPQLGNGIEAYRLSGSLFFGAVHKLEELLDPHRPVPKVIVLSLGGLLNIDSSGLEMLETTQRTLKKRGCTLVLCEVGGQPLSLLRRGHFIEHLGAENVVPGVIAALARAEHLTGQALPHHQ